jgi:purine-binding chemotaxis protein CheW
MPENKSTYVFFKLLDEIFALDVNNVIETTEMQELTPVPETPKFMKGVFIFRGDILPVIDLRLKFKLPEADTKQKKYIIVVSFQNEDKNQKIGFIVDKILQVLALSELDIEQFPEIGSKYNTELINGIVKLNNDITIVLNVEKILSSVEIDIINKAESELKLFNDTKQKNKKDQTNNTK